MKKFILSTTVAMFLFGSAAHAAERVEHYEKKEIQTKKQAFEVLNANNKEIAEILKADKLKTSDLEKIHEISYSLESAIDRLIAEEAQEAKKLERIDESIQAVHYASEEHEEQKVREWFAKLELAVSKLNNQENSKE